MSNNATVGRSSDIEIRRSARRPLALWAVIGYPVGVLILTQASGLGVAPAVAGLAGIALILSSLPAMYIVWKFRGQLAQATDDQLDERQVAVRDRAYLESYRIFAGLTLAVLVIVGIVSDIMDTPITLTFDVINWYVIGIVLVTTILPSAVVAWREADLPAEA